MQQDYIDNEPEVEVWEENWDALQLYSQYSSQWRLSANGPAALDMTVFLHELDRKQICEDKYDAMIYQLSMIELDALKQLQKG